MFLKEIINIVLISVILAIIFALPVMWLWNWLMPDMLGLIKINWIQALGLMTLTSLLFKSGTKSE